jgi:hypothetical protein
LQDRYVGDIGDFGKYGLLRHICAGADGDRPLNLAVNWYLVPNETKSNDGRHVDYLVPGSTQSVISHCDLALHEQLRALVESGRRSIQAVQEKGVFPSRTRFFSERLSFTGIQRANRPAHRQRWIQRAMEETSGADVVFLDPDNGLEVKTPPHSARGPKYVFLHDLPPYLDRGQSIIIYHHIARQGVAKEQLQHRFEQLQRVLTPDYELFAIRFRRGSSRAYFFLGHPDHVLRSRAQKLVGSAWSFHFDWAEPDWS